MRKDDVTGKQYTDHNIPIDRIYACDTPNGKYNIMALSHNHPEDCWYNNEFLGDQYAVFHLENGIWFQVSRWYCYFGRAQKCMFKLTKGVQ